MGDMPIYSGAGAGPARLRDNRELSSYDTRYWGAEFHLGREWPGQKWTPLSSTPIAALSYDYTGGDDANRGSHRHAGFLHGGLRGRFWSGVLAVDGMAGAGVANNHLNFGKGVPLPEDWSLNAQALLSAQLSYCFNSGLCLGPRVATTLDGSIFGDPAYTALRVVLGFEMRMEGNSVSERTGEGRSLQDTAASLKARDYEIAVLRQRLAADRDTAGNPTTKALLGRAADLEKKLAERGRVEYRWITTLPGEVLFQNNRSDIALLPQEFSTHPQFDSLDVRCKLGNPVLDAVIRGVTTRLANIRRENAGTSPRYKIELAIRGFANDTGNPQTNQALADGRMRAIYDYLTGSCGTMTARGDRIPALVPATDLAIRMLNASANPAEDIRQQVMKDNPTIDPNDLATRIENPIWRMATITYSMKEWNGGSYDVVPFDESFKLRGARPAGDPND